jgi:hypothetical protein
MFTGTNVLHRPAALFKLPVNLLARSLFGRHPALLLPLEVGTSLAGEEGDRKFWGRVGGDVQCPQIMPDQP